MPKPNLFVQHAVESACLVAFWDAFEASTSPKPEKQQDTASAGRMFPPIGSHAGGGGGGGGKLTRSRSYNTRHRMADAKHVEVASKITTREHEWNEIRVLFTNDTLSSFLHATNPNDEFHPRPGLIEFLETHYLAYPEFHQKAPSDCNLACQKIPSLVVAFVEFNKEQNG